MRYGPLISIGRTAEVYALPDGKILKLFHPWCPLEWIEGEARNAAYAYSVHIRSPRCHGLVQAEDRNGIVYDRIYGKTMLRLMMSAPWTIRNYSGLLARLHLGIHEVDGATLPSLKKYLSDSVAASDILDEDRKRRIGAILSTLEDGASLCHFDFHPDQVIITEEGPYIIDWMTAFKGNPLADVARTSILYGFGYPPDTHMLMKPLIDLVRNRIVAEYRKAYRAKKGADIDREIKRWSIPVAAARLRENIPGMNDYLLGYIDRSLDEVGEDYASA